MDKIIESINNRDVALFISILVVLGLIILKKNLRESIVDLLKAFISCQIFIPLILLLAYTYLFIFILDNLGFWSLSFMKDLIFWLVGSAFVLFINLPKAMKDESHFRKIIKDSLKLAIVPQFIINLCDFNLITELVLLFVLFFLGAMLAALDLAQNKDIKNIVQVKHLLKGILSFTILSILIFTIFNIVTDFRKFTTLNNLYSFLMPISLTISLMPYLYFMTLYMIYENIFIRSGHWLGKEKQLAKYLKLKVYISCHLNLKKLRAFSTYMNSMSMKSQDGILKEMQDFENYYRQKRALNIT